MHLEDDLSLVLRDIAVYDVRLLAYVGVQRQFVGVAFCLAEYHRSSVAAAVNLQHGADCSRAVVVATADRIVLMKQTHKWIHVMCCCWH